MKKILLSLFLTFACIPTATLFAQAVQESGTIKVMAVQPEVQTAKWAEKWWKPRHDEKLKEKQAMEKVDLLMVGDSITHSWESHGKQIWDKFYASRNPLNIGFSGDRTENVVWRIQNGAVEGISPKLAVVMIGTNNTGHRQDKPVYTAAGIQMIIDELQMRLPETKILLLAIFPRGATTNDPLRKINDTTNKMISQFADNDKVHFLDINDVFLTDDGVLPKSIMPDLLHPNPDGYTLWAEAMEEKVKELMGE